MGKYRQILTELSARDTITAGYYSLTFLFTCYIEILLNFSVPLSHISV